MPRFEPNWRFRDDQNHLPKFLTNGCAIEIIAVAKALEHPITITRNDQSFALLRRENVASFVKAAQHSREIVELLNTAFRLLLKQKIGTEHPYSWLGVFDEDELNEFIDELMSVYRSIDLYEKAWDELEAIIHEWHESALAISNPNFEAAFSQNGKNWFGLKQQFKSIAVNQSAHIKATRL